MSQEEVKFLMHEGWLRTALQIGAFIFMAGMGWMQLNMVAQRVDALEKGRQMDAASQINRIERLTAIETKLDFLLSQGSRVSDLIPQNPARSPRH